MLKKQSENARPTVLIIGAGALGKCLADLLAGQTVVMLYDRNPAITRALKQGCVVRSLSSLKKSKIDFLIFATKIMDLRQAVKEAAGLNPHYVFLPQNGIFDIRWVRSSFKDSKICRGVTTMACRQTSPGQAALMFRGNIYAGGDGALQIAALFRRAGLGAKSFRDPDSCVWAKLIFSAVMNPLPVIEAQGYEILKKDKVVWGLVQRAVEEGRSVARVLGVRLAFDPLRLIRRVRNGDLAGIAHRGTIFQDISAGRPTELDFITGALIRQARNLGIKTPALDTILHKAKKAGA